MLLIPYALGSAIGIAILFSWIGWGGLLNACLIREPKLDWGQKGAWGLALLLVLGGVFEALCVISRQLVLAVLLVGVFLFLIQIIHSRQWARFSLRQTRTMIYRHKMVSALALLVVAVIVLRCIESVHSQDLNWHDDFYGYLVFPQQMLQTGCTGYSPFHHRRLVSALGGKSFLDTFILSLGSIYNIHVIDAGLGLVLTAGVLLGRLRKCGAGPGTTVCIMVVMVLLPPPRINTTALMLASALLLSLFRTLDSTWLCRQRPAAGAVMIALLAAGLTSLKNTYLPPVALTLVVSYLIYLRGSGSWRRSLTEACACVFLIILFLFPWMLSLYHSSDTMLYPLLGKGYSASQYSHLGTTDTTQTLPKTLLLRVAITQPMFVAISAIAALVLIRRRWSWIGPRGAPIAMTIGSAFAAVTIVLVTTGTGQNLQWGANRYCFPVLLPAILALLSVAAEMAADPVNVPPRRTASDGAHCPRLGRSRMTALVIVCILICGTYLLGYRQIGRMYRKTMLTIGQPTILPMPPLSTRLQSLQASIPAGEPILARVDVPFLMDFKRNPIYVVDDPGMVSPPPGMPVNQGAEALAKYLLDQGIRFVVFSYDNEANFSYQNYAYRLGPEQHPIRRTVASRIFDFNKSLQQLALTRRHHYDDGMAFALDLDDRTVPDSSTTR